MSAYIIEQARSIGPRGPLSEASARARWATRRAGVSISIAGDARFVRTRGAQSGSLIAMVRRRPRLAKAAVGVRQSIM